MILLRLCYVSKDIRNTLVVTILEKFWPPALLHVLIL